MADLLVILHAQPDGIVLPKVRSAEDVMQLGRHLEEFERRHGLPGGDIRILPIATETPGAVFALGGYGQCGERLYGLTWGAEDLSAAVGASANREADGSWTFPLPAGALAVPLWCKRGRRTGHRYAARGFPRCRRA